MEQSNMRIDALYNLAVEFQNKSQYAVRRRCCGPKFIVKFRLKASATRLLQGQLIGDPVGF
jgi:hypothetical protein